MVCFTAAHFQGHVEYDVGARRKNFMICYLKEEITTQIPPEVVGGPCGVCLCVEGATGVRRGCGKGGAGMRQGCAAKVRAVRQG